MFLVRRTGQFIARQPSSWVLVALCGVLLAFCPRSTLHAGRKVTIARDTTYLVEPLRADGYVDYRAALDAMSSKGVTPENNAAVLLWQAVGPSQISPPDRAQVFKLLEMAEPAATSAAYLTPVSKYRLKPPPANLAPNSPDPNDPDVQCEQAMDRAWKKEEFPAVAAWLQANSTPLRLVREASGRPRYFTPLVGPPNAGLIMLLLPLVQESRELAYLLEVNANLEIGVGKLDEAWQDALACHRLARLIAQGPTLVDGLVGMAVDGIAMHVDCVIAGSDKLTAEQARRFGREFAAMPPLAGMAEKLDLGDRFWGLDAIVEVATSKNSYLGLSAFGGVTGGPPRWAPNQQMDWDRALRLFNASHDRSAQVAAIASPAERQKAIATLTADLKIMHAEASGAVLNPLGHFDRDAAALAEEALVDLTLSSVSAVINAEDRELERREMCRLAFALTEYRLDHEHYPTALSALVPHYVDAVPPDRFTGKPLHFKLVPGGFLLYGADSDGSDPPLTASKADVLQNHIGIQVPPQPHK